MMAHAVTMVSRRQTTRAGSRMSGVDRAYPWSYQGRTAGDVEESQPLLIINDLRAIHSMKQRLSYPADCFYSTSYRSDRYSCSRCL